MIKVEVIEDFRLEKFGELKNVVRKKGGLNGSLYVGDTFECSQEMVKYLTGANALNKVVVKIIEYAPEEEKTENVEEEKEVVEEEPKEKVSKKSKKSKK